MTEGRPYRIVRAHDTLVLGEDRRPAHLGIEIELEATRTFQVFTFEFDANLCDASITNVQAGNVVSGTSVTRDGQGEISIMLAKPLAPGERRYIEFEVTFTNYRLAPPDTFRRSSGPNGMTEWDVTVCFRHGDLPAAVHGAEWEDGSHNAAQVPGSVIELIPERLEPDDPESEYAVRLPIDYFPPDSVYGIAWVWPS